MCIASMCWSHAVQEVGSTSELRMDQVQNGPQNYHYPSHAVVLAADAHMLTDQPQMLLSYVTGSLIQGTAVHSLHDVSHMQVRCLFFIRRSSTATSDFLDIFVYWWKNVLLYWSTHVDSGDTHVNLLCTSSIDKTPLPPYFYWLVQCPLAEHRNAFYRVVNISAVCPVSQGSRAGRRLCASRTPCFLIEIVANDFECDTVKIPLLQIVNQFNDWAMGALITSRCSCSMFT